MADGPADIFVGGRIDLNPAGESLLLTALPAREIGLSPMGYRREIRDRGANLPEPVAAT